MTPFDPSEFENLGLDLSQLFQSLQSSGPINWEVARQVAAMTATSDDEGNQVEEPSIDLDEIEAFNELARAAQTQVVSATDLASTFSTPVQVTNRKGWTELHVNALRVPLERFALNMSEAIQPSDFDLPSEPGSEPSMGEVVRMLAPVMLGVQAGSMIGFLAQRALGRYDWPLPTSDEPSLCFVAPNINAFGEEWSLPIEDLRFYVALHEVIHAACRSVPWVRETLLSLCTTYMSQFEINSQVLEEQFGEFNPENPEMQELMQDPNALLGSMQTEAQSVTQQKLHSFVSVIEGYADFVLNQLASPLIPNFSMIHEAMQRHRVERGQAERFVESLLGLSLPREAYERGEAFCAGVVSRAELTGLNRLWESAEMFPTESEIDAPGLWLARIEL